MNRYDSEYERRQEPGRHESEQYRGAGRGRRYEMDERQDPWGSGERGGNEQPYRGSGQQWNEPSRAGGSRYDPSYPQAGYHDGRSAFQGMGGNGQERWQQESWRGQTGGGRGFNGGAHGYSGQTANTGQFAGRGPKGYRRSDERIEEDVNEVLSQHPDLDATEIEVKVQNGEVTLSGTVEERQCKRMAEEIVERCSGVQDVRNEIRVQRSTEASGTTGNQHQMGKNKTAAMAGATRGAESRNA